MNEAQVTLEELEKQLADLKARMPAHSIPPSMIAELDELEEALARAWRQRQKGQATSMSEHTGGQN